MVNAMTKGFLYEIWCALVHRCPKCAAFVLQLWEGKDQEAHVTGYAVIDKDSKQVLFVDRRHDVVEYIIEQFAVQLQKQEQTEEPS